MVFKSPLKWPIEMPRTKDRKLARFSKARSTISGTYARSLTIADATKRLREELARHGVRNFDEDVVVSSNLVVTVSGLARADQREPEDPGVVVHWEVDGKHRDMPIDIYNRAADNIAAIAATLAAMRDIERHGGTVIKDKAFAGFDALPAPDSCWRVLRLEDLGNRNSKEQVVAAFKRCVALPEDHRGLPTDMAALVKARDDALEALRTRS